jgi:hypothetical protein
MGQRVYIIGRMNSMLAPIVTMRYYRNRCAPFGAYRNIKEYDGRLDNVHTYNLFDQVVLYNNGIKADHHKDDINPVVIG